MHRHWLYRVFPFVLVAWFTALVAEPATLHPCPMHDGLMRMHAGTGMHHRPGGMAGMHGPASHVEHHGSTSEPDSAAHQCTCIGACTAANAAGFAASRLTLAGALSTCPQDPGLPDYVYVPVTAQHVLPFAHAPPPSPHAA